MPNPFFSGRIPKGLYLHIEEYRQRTKQTKTEILISALADYVDYDLDQNIPYFPSILQELRSIYARLNNLEKEVFKHLLEDNEEQK